MDASRFADVSEEEINAINENSIPGDTENA